MGLKPQCYIPRPKVIGPLVLEKKIFEGFLPYMGVVATLVMWPRCPEQTFVPQTHGGCTWNLASTGLAVLEKKIFENGGQTDDKGQRTDDRVSLYYKLTSEPKGSGELKSMYSVWHGICKVKIGQDSQNEAGVILHFQYPVGII